MSLPYSDSTFWTARSSRRTQPSTVSLALHRIVIRTREPYTSRNGSFPSSAHGQPISTSSLTLYFEPSLLFLNCRSFIANFCILLQRNFTTSYVAPVRKSQFRRRSKYLKTSRNAVTHACVYSPHRHDSSFLLVRKTFRSTSV